MLLRLQSTSLTTFFSRLTNLAIDTASRVLLIIFCYIIVLIILVTIHRGFLKRQKKIHENLVLLYDTIRYQIAKVQYNNPALQISKGIKIVMESEHKNYPANIDSIHQEIVAIEQSLGQQIIPAEQRATLVRQTHKKKIASIFTQLIGRPTTVITVGIYKLFR